MMLIGILGKQYYIWDKQADIHFIRPGSTDLYADFVITEDHLEQILQATAGGEKYFPEFVVLVKDTHGEVVSQVRRVLYVRKKPQYREGEDKPEESLVDEQAMPEP
jgi:hypothetical protein